jgi:hypothetical protein
MNIDINLYRARIGLFGPGRGYKQRKTMGVYKRFTSGTDIHLRVFLMGFYAITIILAGTFITKNLLNSATIMITDNCFPKTINAHNLGETLSSPLYTCYCARLLELSADVETNPGPATNDELLAELKSMKTMLIEEIRAVKTDVAGVKNDVSLLKRDIAEIRSDVTKVSKEQKINEIRVGKCEKDVVKLQDLSENLRIDTDYIDGRCNRHEDNISKLESGLDFLERYANREKMRIFGLKIDPESNLTSRKKFVIDNVLKVADDKICWRSDDIKHVQCFGQLTSDSTPLTIVHFRFEDDKAHVYAGRSRLRDKGIRVGDDLTARQRRCLKELKEKGRHGYFYRGQLVELQPKQQHGDDTRVKFTNGISYNESQRSDGVIVNPSRYPNTGGVDDMEVVTSDDGKSVINLEIFA